MQNKELSKIFGRFAGKEVGVNVSSREMTIGGEKFNIESHDLANENDPTLTDLHATAAKHGLQVRLWLPSWMGTMDFRTDRLNVHIEKAADGKWRIGKNFDIG